jgi:integrase
MSFTVRSAVELEAPSTISTPQLRVGFPFVVESASRKVIEPILLYLVWREKEVGKLPIATAHAIAEDLKDWWGFLRWEKLPWNLVNADDVRRYRDALSVTISPRTLRPYGVETIRRRLSSVIGFYQWAFKRKLLGSAIETPSSRPGSYDALPLAHLKNSEKRSSLERITPQKRRGEDDEVHPLQPEEWERLKKRLGPLPPTPLFSRKAQRGPTRDRLVAEIAINAGLRREEIAALTTQQILQLKPTSDAPLRMLSLRLTKTKGMRRRTVKLPAWLVLALHWYVAHERSASLQLTRRKEPAPPDSLFLNSAYARNNPGGVLSLHTISTVFNRAVVAAGITCLVEETDPSTRERRLVSKASHRFHDLRHTFAVWWYTSAIKSGHRNPMKELQALLGHKNMSTTVNIYLRIVETIEPDVSDKLMAEFSKFTKFWSLD